MSTDSRNTVFTIVTVDPFVRGLLHQPIKPNGKGLVLTHGAGSNCSSPLLVAIAEVFTADGFVVLRCDLPFRQDRPYGPPSPYDGKRDRAGLKNAVLALKNVTDGPISLGGHSYGGRQASMLCAEPAEFSNAGPPSIEALLLMSYPLHPPQKPDQLRTQHFTDLHTPALFVQGTRDAFGSIKEVEQALKMIPARKELLPVEGAGHDLGFKGKARKEQLPAEILNKFRELL